jgi:ubiquinone/menaquinone biosynthesis C-methylase UbiE
MPSQEIYSRHAGEYEQLVSHEDYRGNILPALNRIRPLAGLDVIELGAGTGRLTRLIAPVVTSVRAFDASLSMLQIAQVQLKRSGLSNCHVATGDHRCLPVGSQVADVALAGWTVAQFLVWSEPNWQSEAEQVLAEMRRVVRPGGTIIILETLGTGLATPQAPGKLIPYYSFLEQTGFSSTWIRTDLQFESVAEARALIGFFFGMDIAQQIVKQHRMVPECTGIWWLNL